MARRGRPDPWNSTFIGELFLFKREETYHVALKTDSDRWPEKPLKEQFMQGEEGFTFEEIRFCIYPMIGR